MLKLGRFFILVYLFIIVCKFIQSIDLIVPIVLPLPQRMVKMVIINKLLLFLLDLYNLKDWRINKVMPEEFHNDQFYLRLDIIQLHLINNNRHPIQDIIVLKECGMQELQDLVVEDSIIMVA